MGGQDDDEPSHVLRLGGGTIADSWQSLPHGRKPGARVLGITNGCAERWLSGWDHVRPHPAQLGVVSTTDKVRSTTTDQPIDPGTVGLTVETVDGPDDLTRLGLVIDDYVSAWQAGVRNPVIWFDDLGPLLEANDERDIFRLLHVVRARLDDIDGRLYAELDPAGVVDTDAQMMATLRTAFDRVDRTDSSDDVDS